MYSLNWQLPSVDVDKHQDGSPSIPSPWQEDWSLLAASAAVLCTEHSRVATTGVCLIALTIHNFLFP